MPKYYTVVYEVDPDKANEAVFEAFKTASATDKDSLPGIRITACGWGDYSTQAEAFQAEIEGDGKDPLDVLASYINDEGMGPEDENYRLKALAVMGE